jgi:hypothetical protein
MTRVAVRLLGWLLAAVVVFSVAGAAMLLLGAAHSSDHRVPAFGFTTTFPLVVALFVVLAGERWANKTTDEVDAS